ncbi:MAG: hypothetical protein MHMPM18_000633 [Marteilia pararefringens]
MQHSTRHFSTIVTAAREKVEWCRRVKFNRFRIHKYHRLYGFGFTPPLARLDLEERKFILESYRKYVNADKVQRQVRREFNKEPPT